MKWLSLICLFYVCLSPAIAQRKHQAAKTASIITAKTVLMHRDGETDSLFIPVVNAQYPQLKAALSETHLFNDAPLAENIKHYEKEGVGITSLNYEITYENKGLLSIKLFYEYMGAHPDQSQNWRTLDIHTGKPYLISNEINAAGLQWLFRTYKAQLKQTIATDKHDSKANGDYKDDPDTYDDAFRQLEEAANALKTSDLFANYVFADKGIIFTTGQVLPHVIQAFEPERDWFVPYAKLKQYKKATARVL